ncbi:hypothetical protein ACHAWF_005771 [Thalassiosira exigua]
MKIIPSSGPSPGRAGRAVIPPPKIGPVFHFLSEHGQLYRLVKDDGSKELPNWSTTRGYWAAGRRAPTEALRRLVLYEWSKRQEPTWSSSSCRTCIDAADIIDFAALGEARDEFLHSAQLDSFLVSCYLSLWGLIEHVKIGGVEHARL